MATGLPKWVFGLEVSPWAWLLRMNRYTQGHGSQQLCLAAPSTAVVGRGWRGLDSRPAETPSAQYAWECGVAGLSWVLDEESGMALSPGEDVGPSCGDSERTLAALW